MLKGNDGDDYDFEDHDASAAVNGDDGGDDDVDDDDD